MFTNCFSLGDNYVLFSFIFLLMGWNANGYRKFARSFILIRGVTYLRPASQELNLAPMLINNMVHDGKPQAILWIARH